MAYETLEVFHHDGRDVYEGRTQFHVLESGHLKVISESRTVAIYPEGRWHLARPVDVEEAEPTA